MVFFVPLLGPGQSMQVDTFFGQAVLGQEWHWIRVFSLFKDDDLAFENANEHWLYVEPPYPPQIVITDMSTQAEGTRVGAGILHMVEESYEREARIETDFGGLNFTPGYPRWVVEAGASLFSWTDGNPDALFQGSGYGRIWSNWTGEHWLDAIVRTWPKEETSIQFGTDSFAGFLDGINYTVELLGGGPDRLFVDVALNASRERVDHFNRADLTPWKWSIEGNFILKLGPLANLESQWIPVFGPVAVQFGLQLGEIEINLTPPTSFGYDPSLESPWSAPLNVSPSAEFKITGAVGRDVCDTGITITVGGASSVAFDGGFETRADGVYLDGAMSFGELVADIEFEVGFGGQCVLETGIGVPVFEGVQWSISHSGGVRIYAFE